MNQIDFLIYQLFSGTKDALDTPITAKANEEILCLASLSGGYHSQIVDGKVFGDKMKLNLKIMILAVTVLAISGSIGRSGEVVQKEVIKLSAQTLTPVPEPSAVWLCMAGAGAVCIYFGVRRDR